MDAFMDVAVSLKIIFIRHILVGGLDSTFHVPNKVAVAFKV